MGIFYFDESIHDRGKFILGAFVYTETDLNHEVALVLKKHGLVPGIDEYKSSANHAKNRQAHDIRHDFYNILESKAKIGMVICPIELRPQLGKEALYALAKIITENKLEGQSHQIFFDEEITVPEPINFPDDLNLDGVKIYSSQNSKFVEGIQLADLTAHTLSTMLLDSMGLISKTLPAGIESGYDPPVDIPLGFELWAIIRRRLFTLDRVSLDDDSPVRMNIETGRYCLYLSPGCPENVCTAATSRFGSTFYGCLH